MTTSVSEIANVPREVTIGNRTLKLRQLNLRELFGYFEQKIRSKKLEEANEICKMLEGDEKIEFLNKVWKNLPTGTELTNLATDLIGSADGVYDILYLASKDINEITEEEIREQLTFGQLESIAPVVNWLVGMGELAEEASESNTDNTNDTEEDGEKKT